MTTTIIDNTIVVSGKLSVWEAERFPQWKENGDYYVAVDLSGVDSVDEEIAYRRSIGMSHCGPIYVGNTLAKTVNTLQIIVEKLHAGTVILPAYVTRKILNTCIRNKDIGVIVVPDDCRLFSMKDGNIWNKKGTILIHEQKETPVFVKCEGCRRLFIASAGGKTVDGGLVCSDCQRNSESFIGHTGTYTLFKGLYYYWNDPRLREIAEKNGVTLKDYYHILKMNHYNLKSEAMRKYVEP